VDHKTLTWPHHFTKGGLDHKTLAWPHHFTKGGLDHKTLGWPHNFTKGGLDHKPTLTTYYWSGCIKPDKSRSCVLRV
jgi:hypothetical protein